MFLIHLRIHANSHIIKKDRGFKGVIKQILNTERKKKIGEPKTMSNESKDRKQQ